MKTDLSLYIHIPFCMRKCRYCDFLSFAGDDNTKKEYVANLLTEIEKTSICYSDRSVTSIYIGGGTPSVLESGEIKAIMDNIYSCFRVLPDAEISIEINPGTVDEAKLKEYRLSGINRLSIGLQSALDGELALLGRIHTYSQFENTYNLARKCGFNNINIDLISAIPGQSSDDYCSSLEKVIALKPEHISAYSLILEEGTYLYEHQDEYDWLDEETDRLLYQMTDDILQKAGYHRYEISNYSLDGYECRHNKVYWQRGNYLGLGLGASSMVDNIRFKNTSKLSDYPLAEYENVEHLSRTEQMEEFMFLGLRLVEGISPDVFFDEFGVRIEDIYSEQIDRLVEQGLLVRSDRVFLTTYGMDISNYVFGQFLINN